MIRLGLVDFDTSHAVEFTKRLNHVDIAEDQWVEGARVVAGVPGESKINPDLIPKYTAEMERCGVKLYDDPADLFDKVDAVMIVSVDGNVALDFVNAVTTLGNKSGGTVHGKKVRASAVPISADLLRKVPLFTFSAASASVISTSARM